MTTRLFRQLTSAADLLRPRTFFRTLARVDELADTTRRLNSAVELLRIRTEQLALIERLDWEQHDDLERLAQQLQFESINAHVEGVVRAAELHHEPCPHLVLEGWLPPDVYRCLIDSLPPSVFFADQDERRQQLSVPFAVAPAYSHRVWRFVSDEIVGTILYRALNERFRASVLDYVRTFCPAARDDVSLMLYPSDGRIMLRRPGYTIAPHRDPKWGFITGLVYLARPNDNQTYGTQLYAVRDDDAAPDGKPLYVDMPRCTLMRDVPFRPNTMLAFLNSRGAHGASIPADAQPPSLERYLYQFRLGPDGKTIERLLSLMSPDERARWAGAKSRRAALAQQASA